MNRFDYVKYDDKATAQQEIMKKAVTELEHMVEVHVSPRAKALALTKLEEFYMWVGKAIRDDQIARNGADKVELQEDRSNS